MTLTDITNDRERLKLITLEYSIESDGNFIDEPIIELFCRNEHGERRFIEVEGFYPFFYVTEDEFVEKQDDILQESMIRSIEARDDILDERTRMNGSVEPVDAAPRERLDGTKLVRITTVKPSQVSKLRDFFEWHGEADVFFTNRFLVATGIKRGLSIPAGESRVSVDEIAPLSEDACPSVEPRLHTVDIEVWSGGEFPDTQNPTKPVTAITAHDSYENSYFCGVLHPDAVTEGEAHSWGDSELDWRSPDGVDNASLAVYYSENELLADYFEYVGETDPDLMTGWNSSRNDIGSGFDYPYLINRADAINEWSYQELTYENGRIFVSNRGAPVVDGREMFDMLQAYKKTQIHEKRSYSLEYIAQEELGQGKEDIADLDEGWLHNPVEFMEYNIRDVSAVVEIEQAQSVLDLYDNIRSVAGCTYSEAADSNIGIIDVLFLRQAKDRGLALPTSMEPERGWYYGAKVFNPSPGKHRNVVYPDLASLYPYLMWSLNVSPETIFESLAAAKDSGYDEDDLYTGYIDYRSDNEKRNSDPEPETVYYVKPEVKTGFVRDVVDEMVDMKYEYKGQGQKYAAVKRITNSLYGVFGDSNSYGAGFRLFDWRLAETITIAGRKVLQHTADEFTRQLHSMGYTDAELIGGDSVPENEPTLVRRGGTVEIVSIKDVTENDDVWTDGGWSAVKNIIKKPNRKQLYTVWTKKGITHVTEDHGLIRDNGEEVTPIEASVGDSLLHEDVSSVSVSEMEINEKRAWLLGLFAAEGSCGIYECASGSKASWAINNQNKELLEKAKSVMEDVFGIQTKIDNVMESSNTMKLRLHNNADNASTVLGFREMLYDGVEKRVPTEIINGTEEVQRAFVAGHHIGDGHIANDNKEFDEIWCKHKHLTAGLAFLLQQLGHTISMHVRTNQSDEFYRIRSVSFTQGDDTSILGIEEYDYDGEYVYDLETENHHFQSGIGSIIVHNTDSVMTTIPSAQGMDETLEASFTAANAVNDSYDEFMTDTFNITDPSSHKMEVEIESYADALFFLQDLKSDDPTDGVKKKYSQTIKWDEGETIDDPEPETKGFKLVRSDTSELTAEVQEGVLERILTEDNPKSSVASFLEEKHTAALNGEISPDKIGIPSSISSDPMDYGWSEDDETGETKYFTPQPHIRGARYATAYIDGEDINSGSKPLKFYVQGVHPNSDLPETYQYEEQFSLNAPKDTPDANERAMKELDREVDALAVEDSRNLPDSIKIDWEKMAEKTIEDAVTNIVKTMSWSFDDLSSSGSQTGLADYM
jgi:DNA polymerase elongation subunit (family B)